MRATKCNGRRRVKPVCRASAAADCAPTKPSRERKLGFANLRRDIIGAIFGGNHMMRGKLFAMAPLVAAPLVCITAPTARPQTAASSASLCDRACLRGFVDQYI